jgi:hypothetical protein
MRFVAIGGLLMASVERPLSAPPTVGYGWFAPRWPLCAMQRPLGRIASMPATGPAPAVPGRNGNFPAAAIRASMPSSGGGGRAAAG